CAAPKNMAGVKPSSPSFATRVTNINRRSSIATGWLPIISIQLFRWNRFSTANLKFLNPERSKVDRLLPKAMPDQSQRVGDNAFHLPGFVIRFSELNVSGGESGDGTGQVRFSGSSERRCASR